MRDRNVRTFSMIYTDRDGWDVYCKRENRIMQPRKPQIRLTVQAMLKRTANCRLECKRIKREGILRRFLRAKRFRRGE